MYVVYNKDYIHHLLNESKTWIFAYICDGSVYVIIMSMKDNKEVKDWKCGWNLAWDSDVFSHHGKVNVSH
jgi:hypothetical protein